MKWGCICFDLDNTLLDYEVAFKRGMKYTFRHFFEGAWSNKKRMENDEWFPVFKKFCDELWLEVEANRSTKTEYRKNRFVKSLDYFGINGDAQMASDFQKFFYSVVHQFVEPIEDVASLLTQLKDRNISVGIITNGSTSIQYKKIKRIGLDKWFSQKNVIISEQYKVSKPESLIFQIANEKLNNSILPSLYIGDSWELDVVGSVNAGWDAIYFNSRNERPSTNHSPIATCNSIKEMQKILIL